MTRVQPDSAQDGVAAAAAATSFDRAVPDDPSQTRAIAYRSEDARSRRLYERACEVMPGGNTRHSIALMPYPIYAASGSGCRVTDVEGEERIDFLNNFTSLIHGHADPDVTRAVQAAVARGTAYTAPAECEVALAELLVERVPSVEKIRFCNSGSEAVLLAIKAARAYTGRSRIAKIEGAYHGIYDPAQASERATPEDWGPHDHPATVVEAGASHATRDEVVVMPWNDADVCERLIEENRDSLAAVLVDPRPLAIALIPPKPGFLQRLREVARRHGIVFIADEVMSFRRSYHGTLHEPDVRADLTTLGKIIGGGFPVGAVGGSGEVMSVFDHTKELAVHHGGTYSANPVTMTAGLTAMRMMTREAYAELERLGDQLRDGLRQMLRRRGWPGQVFGSASLFSVRLTEDELTDFRSVRLDALSQPVYGELCHEMLGRGIMTSRRSVIGSLSTPMTVVEADAFIDALERSLTALGYSRA